MDFEWDDANILHIARHGVSPQEAEEVTRSNPCDLGSRSHNGELRMTQPGRTDTGRILHVVVTRREKGLRVVTAYPATKKSRQFLLRQTGDSDVKND